MPACHLRAYAAIGIWALRAEIKLPKSSFGLKTSSGPSEGTAGRIRKKKKKKIESSQVINTIGDKHLSYIWEITGKTTLIRIHFSLSVCYPNSTSTLRLSL